MEFTPAPSSIFQNKNKFINNNKSLSKWILWKNIFWTSRYRSTPLHSRSAKLRSGRITQYIWLAPAVARPIFAFINWIDKIRNESKYQIYRNVIYRQYLSDLITLQNINLTIFFWVFVGIEDWNDAWLELQDSFY